MILNPAYDFLKEDYKNPNLTQVLVEIDEIKKKSSFIMPKLITLSIPTSIVTSPITVFAATTDSTFKNVYDAVMNIFDAGVVLVIIFAGAAWTLGHRSKAIELLIGVCCGYLLARHAVDIRDFLKSI